jgi:hypothetical protein
VEPFWVLEAKRAVEQNLAGGGFEQVGPTRHFCDAHGRVVGNAGKLITGTAVASPDHKIAEIFAGNEALWTEVAIFKLDYLAVVYAESPMKAFRLVDPAGAGLQNLLGTAQLRPARAGVYGLVVEGIL